VCRGKASTITSLFEGNGKPFITRMNQWMTNSNNVAPAHANAMREPLMAEDAFGQLQPVTHSFQQQVMNVVFDIFDPTKQTFASGAEIIIFMDIERWTHKTFQSNQNPPASGASILSLTTINIVSFP
jgi:hypothetical protein